MVVTHATSYDILVGSAILHPFGVIIDFWEEIAYYNLVWQTRINCKASLPMKFIKQQVRKSNKSIMLIGFPSLSHGCELLKCNIHDKNEPPHEELVMLGP
jgi:hypothetical protein